MPDAPSIDLKRLFDVPHYEPASSMADWQPDVKPIFYKYGQWSGRPAKAFAWLGLPKLAPGQKCPGIVLVHGGGGTAFADWVKLWNSRGYAAIAMDNCGGVPCWNPEPYCRYLWPRHEFSGPPGWGDFAGIDKPLNEQWPQQALETVIAANSLLRSLPEVDASRIGITGVSWGAVLTCLAASFDSRFAFAIPVYGCGFLDLMLFNEAKPPKSTPEKNAKWLSVWDPSLHLPKAKAPFLWVTGTNDFAFSLDSMAKSASLPPAGSEFRIVVRMTHGHGAVSHNPPEILDFANHATGHGERLEKPALSATKIEGSHASASFKAGWQASKAEFNYTLGSGIWQERLWETAPARLSDGIVSADVPAGATACYFNLISSSGFIYSSCPMRNLQD